MSKLPQNIITLRNKSLLNIVYLLAVASSTPTCVLLLAKRDKDIFNENQKPRKNKEVNIESKKNCCQNNYQPAKTYSKKNRWQAYRYRWSDLGCLSASHLKAVWFTA